MLDYSEYKSLMDIVDKSDAESMYPDLMKKETKVLDTVNHVVNHYKDTNSQNSMFMHKSMYEIYNLFFLEWPVIMSELLKVKSVDDVIDVLTKNDRLIYIGILLVLASFILFFVNSST